MYFGELTQNSLAVLYIHATEAEYYIYIYKYVYASDIYKITIMLFLCLVLWDSPNTVVLILNSYCTLVENEIDPRTTSDV